MTQKKSSALLDMARTTKIIFLHIFLYHIPVFIIQKPKFGVLKLHTKQQVAIICFEKIISLIKVMLAIDKIVANWICITKCIFHGFMKQKLLS